MVNVPETQWPPCTVIRVEAGSRVRAVKVHEIPARAPLQVSAGQRVTVGERDTHWPAFVFVTADSGAGWVPSRYLGPDGTVLTPYDTTELPTAAGDLLTVLAQDDESGWLWVRAADGREGWVPIDTVEPVP